MKKLIRKILRLIIVFLSSFCLVCGFLPKTAMANEYNGNTYSYADSKKNIELYFQYVVAKLEEAGYSVSENVENWTQAEKDLAYEWGLDVSNATGRFVSNSSEYIYKIVGPVIDYGNSYVQDFLECIKDFDVTDETQNGYDLLLRILEHIWFPSDVLTLNNYLENQNSYSERTKDNLSEYFKYKNYGLARGSHGSVSGSSVSSDNWANSQELYFNYFRPEWFLAYDNPSVGGYASGNGYGGSYIGSASFSYNESPFDLYGISGSGTYNNGLFNLNTNIVQTDFNVDVSRSRFVVRMNGLYNRSEVAIFSPDLVSVVPISNCIVRDSCVVTPIDLNNSDVSFYVYVSSAYTSVKVYTENFNIGGVVAPGVPVYKPPVSGSSTYDNDNRVFNYITTETDRLLDEYDVSQLYNDLYNSFEGSTWLTFPLEVWRDFGDVLRSGYRDYFEFSIDRIDLDFVELGLEFPATTFKFDYYEYLNSSNDLQVAMAACFLTFRYIVAFGYFYALIIWGRSLILRIGSDTIHRDYEG